MDDIGKRIKTYREARKISQQELSRTSRVSLGLIQQIEQGRHSNPSIKVLKMFADALEIDIVDLITEEIDIKSKKEIQKLKQAMKFKYVPVFDRVPTETEISLKDISKVIALIPVPNRKIDYVMMITQDNIGTGLASFAKKFNYVGIRRTKEIKDKRIYLLNNKKKYVMRICEVFPGKIVFYGAHGHEPIIFDKNIKIIGEVIFWSRSALSEV